MKFAIAEKIRCKECGGITKIQKGLNKQDYHLIIQILLSALVLVSVVALSLYVSIKQ